ncbi:MAG: lipopolysaccharide transport periplasmic protein LptA [Mariprofundaceae bacterium]|nr:lipopolysaccharide transport periplasmic protein LptA [Mariprofundaceae bacterium]
MKHLVFMLFFLTVSPAFAAPMHIEADHLDIQHDKHTAKFTGKVYLLRDDFSLWCDNLTVYYQKKSKKIEHVHAQGHVKIKQGERSGKSDEADYYHLKDLLILRGHAEMEQEGGYIQGEIIEHDMKASQTKVHQGSGGRVHVSIESE